MSKLFSKAPSFWERRGPTSLLLWPLSVVFGQLLRLRKLIHELDPTGKKTARVPIIIVGNIRVGGTGKTPIVISLAERLSVLGWHPGIISRGYGADTQTAPMLVTSDSDPTLVGDEPVLIAKRTDNQFPLYVYPKRKQSIAALLDAHPQVDVIISDDGLQHTGLVRWPAREGGRDVEFVVRDQRGEGNGFLLPAGPLREPSTRERDATLIMGSAASLTAKADEYFLGRRAFTLRPHFGRPYQLINPQAYKTLDDMNVAYSGKSGRTRITAVAAIGNPKRFFGDLEKHGLKIKGIGLPDHSSFTADFFEKIDADCILITEKDAVKCKAIHDARIWVVPMHLNIPEALLEWLQTILHRPDPNRYTL